MTMADLWADPDWPECTFITTDYEEQDDREMDFYDYDERIDAYYERLESNR